MKTNSPGLSKKEKKLFTLKNYSDIYQKILGFSKTLSIKNKDKMIDKIKQFTEFQIWGDQHDDTFFEY
jgi:dsDNA-binding SOS-regulon protein